MKGIPRHREDIRRARLRGTNVKGEPVKGYYKVPFRQVYCTTLRQWVAAVILCHVVYRLDPPKLPSLP